VVRQDERTLLPEAQATGEPADGVRQATGEAADRVRQAAGHPTNRVRQPTRHPTNGVRQAAGHPPTALVTPPTTLPTGPGFGVADLGVEYEPVSTEHPRPDRQGVHPQPTPVG